MQFKTCGKLRARDADLLWACKRELHKRQFGALLHPPGHLSRHRQVETPSVAQRKAWLEDERHPGLVSLTRTDFRDLKSSQGPARTARSAKAGLGRFFWCSPPKTLTSIGSGVKSSGPGRRCAGHAGWRSRAGDRCRIVCLSVCLSGLCVTCLRPGPLKRVSGGCC